MGIDMPSSPTHDDRVRCLLARRNRTRDWSELPLDVICSIFHKLDHTEILMGAGQVCRFWRSAARDEPHLWRRIYMQVHSGLRHYEADLVGMAREAVLRSKGLCEAFLGECAADDDFLLYLGTQAPSLKSLRLIKCYVSTKGFIKAIKKFPQLEELELSLSTDIYGMRVFNTVGRSCQQLKRLKLTHHGFYNLRGRGYRKDAEALGIATIMTELRSLEMFGNGVTNKGLIAILDSCPNLESLDIRHCFNVDMDDDALRAKCALIKTLKLPKG